MQHTRSSISISVRVAAVLLSAMLQTACVLDRGGPSLISSLSVLTHREQASGLYHTVESGETLAALAKAYAVDLSQLAEANKLKEPYEMRPGSRIFVPGATAVRCPAEMEHSPQTRGQVTTPSGTLAWPVAGKIVSQFRVRKGPEYNGIGIGSTEGTPVNAAADGKVGHVGSIGGLGNLVLIAHADRLVTVYAHLKDVRVTEGESVKRGAVIGTVGTSGRVDMPCLYFEVRSRSCPRNPLFFLEGKEGNAG